MCVWPAQVSAASARRGLATLPPACALRPQFYTWYFHALPLLLAHSDLTFARSASVMLGIEYAFNVGDAEGAGSRLSSIVLQCSHAVLLASLASTKTRML